MDYNAPLLTLAAMHIVDDTTDPFYTSLGPGASKPSRPCDAADGCSPSPAPPSVSSGAKIAIPVVATWLALVASFMCYVYADVGLQAP